MAEHAPDAPKMDVQFEGKTIQREYYWEHFQLTGPDGKVIGAGQMKRPFMSPDEELLETVDGTLTILKVKR